MWNEGKSFYSLVIDEGVCQGDAEELSKVLLAAPNTLRRQICKSYGLSIDYSGDQPVIFSDGVKIGQGHSFFGDTSLYYEIKSKVKALRIEDLLDTVSKKTNRNYGALFQKSTLSAGGGYSEFGFSFLLGLIQDIADFSTQLLNVFSQRKKIVARGSPRGRINPVSFVRNQMLSKHDEFECMVLDNTRLREYATVFLQTVNMVKRDLDNIGIFSVIRAGETEAMVRSIQSMLRGHATASFSFPLLVRLSRPPFPYGIRDLFMKCFRYWKSRGQFRTGQSEYLMALQGFSINMASLFEDYAGMLLEDCLPDSAERFSGCRFSYFKDQAIERFIEPDHLFIFRKEKIMVVAEIKYSGNYIAREHVSQLVSYLDFLYPEWSDYEKVGLLIYPGDPRAVEEGLSFGQKLLPVQISSNYNESKKVIYDILKKQPIRVPI